MKQDECLTKEICMINIDIDTFKKNSEQISLLEKEIRLYQIYIKVVGRDGLPYKLLNNLVPQLEQLVNRILLPITDFSVKIEQDVDNSISLYKVDNGLKHNLELCSGFQKFVVKIAMRIALINLSKLSSGNFMIIDEGFSCMDSNNINNVSLLFTMLKDMFDFVVVISHIDSIKDQCEKYINIERNGTFSKIVY
jgi:DNA repair exonuclease SbcCD ATPase subunit